MMSLDCAPSAEEPNRKDGEKDGFARADDERIWVVATKVMLLELPWIPSDRREASFARFSLGYPTALPRYSARTGGVASWTHAVSIEEVRGDWLQCDSLRSSDGLKV